MHRNVAIIIDVQPR